MNAGAAAHELHAIPYNYANDAVRLEMALLQHRVAPVGTPVPSQPLAPEHDPALNALCFYLCAEQRVISYAAVVYKPIRHAGLDFWIAGLSCVATDPAYQRQGLGSRTVGAASRCIAASQVDLGLFTCDPPLVSFYGQAGWPVASDVLLIGNQHATALTSIALNKVVLLRLFSPRAQALAEAFRHTTIDLDLPDGQFL